jgi:hypothetical protein
MKVKHLVSAIIYIIGILGLFNLQVFENDGSVVLGVIFLLSWVYTFFTLILLCTWHWDDKLFK